MADIAGVLAIGDTAARVNAFQSLLSSAASKADVHTIKAVIDAVLDESLPLTMAKSVLKTAASVVDEHIRDNAAVENIADHALTQLRSRVSSFEEADFAFRDVLYRIYVGEGDFLRAATVLSQARMESNVFSEMERARTFIHVAQNYIKADDDVNAERFIRAVGKINISSDLELSLQYKTCFAQLLDQKRKFLEAAGRYMELMRLAVGMTVEEVEIKIILEKAAKCAILAPAGPQRQRVLGMMMRDEKIGLVAPVGLGMLEKMYTDRIVMPADAAAFEETLAIHQRAVGSDGMSVFQRAVIEHNIHAASKVYANITFDSLAAMLGIDAARTEKTAAKMIKENRLAANIDQVDRVLEFGSQASEANKAAAPGAEALLAWDHSIKEICGKVNDVVGLILQAHPELAPV